MASITAAAANLVDEVTSFVEPSRTGSRKRKRLVMVERGDEFECYRVDRSGTALITKGRLDELSGSKLPRQLLAQPLDMEMLEIEHALAKLAARRPQQTQRLGMSLEEIGMAAQIGEDVAAGNLARRARRGGRLAPAPDGWTAARAALGMRLVARAIDHCAATLNRAGRGCAGSFGRRKA